jgi:predicted AAA+ superfamily ATPase
MDRSVTRLAAADLAKKMVFLTGPRQVGKTWIAQELAARTPGAVYLNYDRAEDARLIRETAWPARAPLLVFDELHKMPGWKNYLKGVFDTRPAGQRILVTGSARLETFRQSGDSLAGRFFLHRVAPFGPAELRAVAPEGDAAGAMDRLLERGGFPEPFLADAPVDADRWRSLYADALIQQDILDFERVHDLRTMRALFGLLRARVGSPLSFAALAGDLQVSPSTVIKYVEVLEALYIVFRVAPYSANIARSLLKEPKLYFFDVGLVAAGPGARLENLAAVALQSHVWALADRSGADAELRYLRTKDGREVDFCLVRSGRPETLVEVKTGQAGINPSLWYFCEKYGLAGVQLVRDLRLARDKNRVAVRDAAGWLADLAG